MGFLQKTILTILGNSALFWALHTRFVPYMFTGTGNTASYLGLGILFSVVNYFLKPILKLISFPLSFLTLGLFGFIVNGALIYAVHFLVKLQILDFVTLEFTENYLYYIILGAIFSLANSILHWFEN
ncbi:hypothetical protein CSB37_00650 [bacterium DOLZORAL124_38_8]|nr:MAG: hypothetical protein CSB37_00650 [bacterium DOLZORAL124_38_8]